MWGLHEGGCGKVPRECPPLTNSSMPPLPSEHVPPTSIPAPTIPPVLPQERVPLSRPDLDAFLAGIAGSGARTTSIGLAGQPELGLLGQVQQFLVGKVRSGCEGIVASSGRANGSASEAEEVRLIRVCCRVHN